MSREHNPITPEDAAVVAEVLTRIRLAIISIPVRADYNLNQRDFYEALGDEISHVLKEAETNQ